MKSVVIVSATAVAIACAAFSFNDPRAAEAESVLSGNGSGTLASDGRPAEPTASVVWKRPEGPLRVALQAGHWKAAEAPEEQAGLRGNGTRGGGKAEWEVNLEIARKTAALLEGKGYVVEILPTTIPPGYLADLFVSIHADGSPNSSISGFRAAAPRRDMTGRAEAFSRLLESRYAEATGLPHYPTVTRRMTGYYAFNYRRYEHALHPMTVSVILETGFLTSPSDRRVIVSQQDRAARGIADAINFYLRTAPLETKVVTIPQQPFSRRRDRIEPLRTDRPSSDAGVAPASESDPAIRAIR